MKNIFLDYVLSPDLPEEARINKTVFYFINILFFVLIFLLLQFSSNKSKAINDGYFTPWNAWVLVVSLVFVFSFLKSFKAPFRFLGLALYAYNRRILLSLALNILVFPIEWFILENSKASLREVTSIFTLFIKATSYSYLYFMLFQLIKDELRKTMNLT